MTKASIKRLEKKRMPDNRLLVCVNKGAFGRMYAHTIGRDSQGRPVLGWVGNPLHAQNYPELEADQIVLQHQQEARA